MLDIAQNASLLGNTHLLRGQRCYHRRLVPGRNPNAYSSRAAIAQAPPAMEYEHLETTGSSVQLRLAAGETVRTLRTLGRMATDRSVDKEAALSRLEIVRRDHDRMTDRFPRLEGDWPSHWPNGFRYDFETARACVMSPSGVFDDYWLSWMTSWPRSVLGGK